MTEGLDVVVLAAGQGTRMRSSRPKVLHEIAGRSLLERVVDVGEELGADRLHVVYGHGGDAVREATHRGDIRWVHQPEQLGTGHAVAQVLPGLGDGIVLILYGDVPLLSAETCRRLLTHASGGTVALLTACLDDASGYGRILRDEQGLVTSIIEDKDATEAQRAIREINTGILAADASSLKRWVGGLGTNNAQGEYYLTDIIGLAVAEGKAISTVHPNELSEVLGVNDRAQLAYLERCFQRRQVQALMARGVTVRDPDRLDVRGEITAEPDVTIDVNVVLEGTVHLAEGVEIGPNNIVRDSSVGKNTQLLANCVIEEASIGPDCRVGPFARLRPGAELGASVHIGNYVEVKKSSIGDGSKVNHLTYVGDSEVGRAVNIGAGTITCNYDGANKHRTVIEDEAFIGSGVELVAPVRVGRGATIGAGSTIGKDAPAQELTFERARQKTISGWKRPVKRR